MADLYVPDFTLFINGVDVTLDVRKFLISIDLEDIWDTNLTVSKLELIFHAKYVRNWLYKDTIKLNIFWESYPGYQFVSNTFYVDYVENSKSSGGLQTYRVSAIEADPSLGFQIYKGQLTYTNKTILSAVTDFKNTYGLTLAHNIDSTVYLGTIKDVLSTSSTNATATFTSYAEMLRYVGNNFGYFVNLSGKNLTIYDINSDNTYYPTFYPWSLNNIYSFDSTYTYSKLSKTYSTRWVNLATNTVTVQNVSPQMSSGLNNITVKLEDGEGYYNQASALKRLNGEIFRIFVESFEVRISCSASHDFKAGDMFLLDYTYGVHEGYYICTKARHKLDASGWNCELTGFPFQIISATNTALDAGYIGRVKMPPDTNVINVNQAIAGTLSSVVTGAMLDSFAKFYNPSYTLNLGATFITEGNKTGNAIRPDIAFVQAMLETNNFKDTFAIGRFNPAGLRNSNNTADATFANWQTGIRAQIQHLFAFAKATGSPADVIVDPRYSSVIRGSATRIDDLESRWNTKDDYSYSIKTKLQGLYEFLYPDYNINIIG